MTTSEQLLHSPTITGAPTNTGGGGAGVRIRHLTTMAECHECVALQQEVWGWERTDVVPPTLLHVVEYVGGLLAGAFDADDKLQGFVFGITGVRDGELVHWSHMLGVRESIRNVGIGRMLKEYQRATLAERGVKHIYWTFDPLMAKNAHLNVNRLGARVTEYVPDMYGSSTSPLHLGLATDRLIVRLDTTAPAGGGFTMSDHFGTPVLSAFPRPGDMTLGDKPAHSRLVLIEVPADVLDVIERAPADATRWRLAVREQFAWAFEHGYVVRGVYRDRSNERAFYILTREGDV